MPRVAQAAADALSRLDAPNADRYQSGLAAFQAAFAPVTAEVARLKQGYAGAPVAFTEPVFAYMADAAGFVVKSPPEFMHAVEEGNDPPAAAVAQEQDLITRHQVRLIFYNSQTVTKVTARMKDLAVANHVPVIGVSETEPPGKTYQQWQLSTLKEVEDALAT
jgi:zinc/manganese transport system substrate-binding protein